MMCPLFVFMNVFVFGYGRACAGRSLRILLQLYQLPPSLYLINLSTCDATNIITI